jgi:hypothetical protein
MNKTSKFLLCVFVLITSSCNASSGSLPTLSPATANPESPILPTRTVESPTQPTEMTQTQSPVSTEAENNCDGYKWTFHPAFIYRYPEDNGFDIVIVDMAVHNGSDKYWGWVDFAPDRIYITTEDGYEYEPWMDVKRIPDNPPSPYNEPGTNGIYRQYLTLATPTIPPGFTIIGNPTSQSEIRDVIRYTFGFEVASSQKSLTMHLSPWIICCNYGESGECTDAPPEQSYSLDELANYPLPTSEDFPNVGSELIVVPDFGTYEYKGLSEQDGKYALQFSFTNANGGYATKAQAGAYLVGDDGMYIPSQSSGTFDAGPGQTVDGMFRFPKSSGVNNLKFIFIDWINNVYKVYDFVP